MPKLSVQLQPVKSVYLQMGGPRAGLRLIKQTVGMLGRMGLILKGFQENLILRVDSFQLFSLLVTFRINSGVQCRQETLGIFV